MGKRSGAQSSIVEGISNNQRIPGTGNEIIVLVKKGEGAKGRGGVVVVAVVMVAGMTSVAGRRGPVRQRTFLCVNS